MTIVWHFAADKLRDGSPLPKAGDILPHIDNIKPCERGWHGSVKILDALQYAPGFNLAQRELTGTILPHGSPIDKYCASDASMLTEYVNVKEILIEFSRYVALRALRIHAPKALRKAGLVDHADKLAALPDDCDIAAARAAGDAAWAAARAAAWAAGAAAWAAGDAAGDAEIAHINDWLENKLRG